MKKITRPLSKFRERTITFLKLENTNTKKPYNMRNAFYSLHFFSNNKKHKRER